MNQINAGLRHITTLVLYGFLLCILIWVASCCNQRIDSLTSLTLIIGFVLIVSLHEVRMLPRDIVKQNKKRENAHIHSDNLSVAIVDTIRNQNELLKTIINHMEYHSRGIKQLVENTKK